MTMGGGGRGRKKNDSTKAFDWKSRKKVKAAKGAVEGGHKKEEGKKSQHHKNLKRREREEN